MKDFSKNNKGFTLIEVLVGTAIFLLFAMGVYGGLTLVLKVVYQSRLQILETGLLSEELEVVRNLPFGDVGLQNGVPNGVLEHEKIMVRNNLDFTVITTVRNIDDAFDGTVDGEPEDTSPADYKLVEVSAICASCEQRHAVVLSTIVAPKNLEGDSNNGNLFINVFNSDGLPVSGADVHVENNIHSPAIVIDDVTDSNGWLKIIDTPTGTLAYDITVSKSGFSTDYTVAPSLANPSPTKLSSNVATQDITEIYLSIDELASLNIDTISENCNALSYANFNMLGDKEIGDDPVVYKFNQNITTDALGNYYFSTIEWDDYIFDFAFSSYVLAGSIPAVPLDLNPGQTQNLSLILKNRQGSSLLVSVLDAGTELPLSDTEVRLYNASYDQSLTTGLGYVRQTDWSGGNGQLDFVFDDRYYFASNIDDSSPAGDLKLEKVGSDYLSNGQLESSIFDLGSEVDFVNIVWEPWSQAIETGDNSIVFQIATTNTTTPESWDYFGPDGTAQTFYTATSTVINSIHQNSQYLRYKVYLSTENNNYTPKLSEVAFTYTNNCTPPGQIFFDNLSNDTYELEISRSGYVGNYGEVIIDGDNQAIVYLSAD